MVCLQVFLGVQIRFDDFVEVIKSAAKKDFMLNSAQFVLNNGLNGMNLEFEGRYYFSYMKIGKSLLKHFSFKFQSNFFGRFP